MHLAPYPRIRLGHLPTPLEFMPQLTKHLSGPNLYIKRDDCTGLATGCIKGHCEPQAASASSDEEIDRYCAESILLVKANRLADSFPPAAEGVRQSLMRFVASSASPSPTRSTHWPGQRCPGISMDRTQARRSSGINTNQTM